MTAAFIPLFAIWLFAGTVPQKSAGARVIASSNDWKITAEQFEDILKTLPPEGRQRFSVPANRRDLAQPSFGARFQKITNQHTAPPSGYLFCAG